MKWNRCARVALVALATVAWLLAGGAAAADKGKKKKVAKRKAPALTTLVGSVEAKLARKGKVKAVTLRAEDGTSYLVVMNRSGVKLGKTAAGKEVEVTGTVVKKGTKKKPVAWLTVKKFTVREAPPPAPDPEPDYDDPLPDPEEPPIGGDDTYDEYDME